MKNKIILIVAVLFLFSFNTLAQVNITSNKVTYSRKGKNISDYKKTFEVNYPKFSNIKNPDVQRNLDNSLNYWKNFEITLEESLGDYTWLDSFDYKINYNKNSLLDISLIMEGSGAYPDGTEKVLVINLKTGKRIFINYAFTNIGQLLVKLEKAQKAEIQNHLAEIKKDNPEDYSSAKEMFDDTKYALNKLDEFSINDAGVTFIFDYGFPHAIQALEPQGRYFFTWSQMKPFIKRDGLLAGFIR